MLLLYLHLPKSSSRPHQVGVEGVDATPTSIAHDGGDSEEDGAVKVVVRVRPLGADELQKKNHVYVLHL